MTRTKAIAAVLCAALFAGLAAYQARQRTIDRLESQVEQLEAARREALAKAQARERELDILRQDSAALARLRAQLKTNPPPPVTPAGIYLDKDKLVYVNYGTPDPALQAYLQALMNGSYDMTAKGRAIFLKICAACHQPDGAGKDGVGPPLAGSEWVLSPGGGRLARIVLNGIAGPIRVQDRDWNLPMPPWRENLTDDQIAVVLSYIRSELGTNKAPPIKPESVGAARQEAHPGPESAAELSQISDQ
jgi:mono/diheme cytochrome c family protein